MASLPPSFSSGSDPARLLHPNAPAAGCGFGNSRVPGALCAGNVLHAQVHPDAPAHHAAWYDPLLGVFPRRVMAVYHAITGARRSLARALIDATGMELHDILAGILPSLLIMVAVLALSTTIGAAAGAALGALAGGVGAIPGAAAGATVGLEAGTALLEWLGLAFLVVYIGKSLLAGTKLAATAVGRAWHSVDQSPAMREVAVVTASHELATAVALVFRGVLQGLVAFLLAKGTAAAASRVPELVASLRKSRLGGSFASWVEHNWAALVENPKLREAPRLTFGKKAPLADTTTPSKTRAAGGVAATGALDAQPSGKGVYFFNREVLPYIDRPDATLGRAGEAHFFMPLEDSYGVTDAASAYRYTGGAPSLESAYKSGSDIFGVEFPTETLSPRLPTANDTTLPHFLEGGNTALRLPDNGGYLVNPTHEFVVPGGGPIPAGSTLFQIGPDGTRVPIRSWGP